MTPTQLTPFAYDYTLNLQGKCPVWDINRMTVQHRYFHPAYQLHESRRMDKKVFRVVGVHQGAPPSVSSQTKIKTLGSLAKLRTRP